MGSNTGYGFVIGRETWNNAVGRWENYISLDNAVKFLFNHKKNLKKDELEVLNILSDVLNGNITFELPIEKYPVEDIFEEICFNGFSEKNPLNQVDCDVLGDNYCIETIIANVIHRETDLPVGYFKDANLDGAYIMYSPSYPWEASDNERKIKEKEDINKIFDKYKDELIKEDYKSYADNGYQTVEYWD